MYMKRHLDHHKHEVIINSFLPLRSLYLRAFALEIYSYPVGNI
jgi:hypothetical protein